MKVAVLHDWLETYAGAERVLEQILKLYPEADLYALVDFLPNDKRGFIGGRKAKTTFIQHLPLARRYFRHYLPMFPMAVEALNLNAYDLIISSSHCVAKGVRVREGQIHICYCHTPVRYAWDMQEEYLSTTGQGAGLKGKLIRFFLERLRKWDKKTAPRVTSYIANSSFIAGRIKQCYGLDAIVIHPPVATQDFKPCADKQDYYFTASRMVPYKRFPLIAGAFAKMPSRKLVMIGAGPESHKVAEIADKASNIEYLGYQPFPVLKEHMQKARAFVFAAQEDFGIMPVEALACGTPVIAYGKGGALDSVTPETGIFFEEQTPESIIAAIEAFEKKAGTITPEACRAQAEKFSEEIFHTKMRAHIKKVLIEKGLDA
ncbi:MAG: glycosyltransferase [Rhodospirillales bacterium]|nr:glycosyltransferase [Alphaproteobacteria bacterium]MCB9981436.1 glycosyltransferase [Rhodospirillales bacterium]